MEIMCSSMFNLLPPDAKNWLIRKDPDAGKDWRQEEKGTAEDEMVGWHHWLNGREFERASGNGERQGRLACCSPCGHKESDMTEWLNNTMTAAMLTNEATELQVSLSPPHPCLQPHCMWDRLFLLKFWFSQKSRELEATEATNLVKTKNNFRITAC